MERIRENMFFLVCGVVVAAAVAFYLFYPGRAENQAKQEEVAGLLNRLNIWTKQPFVYNTSAVDAAKQYHKNYEAQFEAVKAALVGKRLKDTLPGLTDRDSTAVYSKVYHELVGEIERQMSRGIVSAPDAWKPWDWGTRLPESREQRIEAAKEYWLTTEVLDILKQEKLGVVQLDKLEIEPGTQKNERYVPAARDRFGEYFEIIPLNIAVKTDFQKWRMLVDALLKAETPIMVRRVSMSRLVGEELERYHKRFPIPPPVIIGVQLECWALDYREGPAVVETMLGPPSGSSALPGPTVP